MNRMVISRKQLPTTFPIVSTVVCWLVLDRFKAPEWAWGIAGTLGVILWVICIYAVLTEDYVELPELKNKIDPDAGL